MKKLPIATCIRCLCLAACLLATSFLQANNSDTSCSYLKMTLKDGPVIIKMRPDLAPDHVKRVCELSQEGFYNGLVFHRVIAGFMAQTGDPTGTGMGGSGQNLKAEFSSAPHKRGMVSMARAQDPDSADSQFFIVLQESLHLDDQYTVFGEVTSGMEHVDRIKKGTPGSGTVNDPDKIISLTALDQAPNHQD